MLNREIQNKKRVTKLIIKKTNTMKKYAVTSNVIDCYYRGIY